jgi:hypothetical protein
VTSPRKQGSRHGDGTKRSPESAAPKTWTREEQEAAVPLPLPSVPAEPIDRPSPTQAVHGTGAGSVSPAGLPERKPPVD